MKRKVVKLYKVASFSAVFAQLFVLIAMPFSAQAVELPMASYVNMGTVEDLVKVANTQNTPSLTDAQVRDQSSANKKISGPQVKVLFNKSNVQSGDKITAEAKTTGFTKGDDSVYFTWFLKHRGCDLGKNVDKGSFCDPDGDGKVTVNDWKVEAMRMVARGDFDSNSANYNGDKTNDQEKADGYDAYFGNEIANGDNADNAACYFQDFSTGRMFELAQIEPQFTCPSGQHQQCVENKKINTYLKTNPSDPNQPPLTPTLPLVPEIEKNVCQAVTSNNSSTDMNDPACQFANANDIDIYKLTSVCANGSRAVCIPDNGYLTIKSSLTTTAGYMFAKTYADSNDCNNNSSICSLIGIGTVGAMCANLFAAIDTATTNAKTSATDDPNPNAFAKCDYKKDAGICKHLFPKPEKGTTGDGRFTMAEEKFWGTNPLDPKTAKNQNVDEANVVGLGMNNFTWEYRTDDQVGVVVEGTFTKETQHADGSKMVMWALPNNACDDFEKEAKDKGFYTEDAKNILAVDFDIDRCLKDNLLDPSGAGKLNIDVTYAPSDNLVNDPDGGAYSQGSMLDLTANVSGFSQSSSTNVSLDSFYFIWKVEVMGVDVQTLPPINTDTWIDVTNKIKTANPNLQMEGLGLSKLEMPLNIPDNAFVNKTTGGVQYIRAKAEVVQMRDGGEGLRGKGTAIIKINQLNNAKRIRMYPVSAGSDAKLTLLTGKPELCNDAQGKFLCYVTENEIVGLTVDKTKYSAISWTVNGKAASCTSAMSAQCDSSNNIVFFPATKTDDGTIKVTLTAMYKDSNSSSSAVKMDRYFSLTDPAVAIGSGDYTKLMPKLMGYYKGIYGDKTPDYSTVVYETAGSDPFKLKALFYPQWKADQSDLEWYVNGNKLDEFTNKKEIEIDPAGMDEINVDLNVSYNPGLANQVANMRAALYKYWQISPAETAETNDSTSIRIENNGGGSVVAKGSGKWYGAMLSSHISTQVLFVLRLFLTTLVFMFVVGIVFAIIPGEYVREEKRY